MNFIAFQTAVHQYSRSRSLLPDVRFSCRCDMRQSITTAACMRMCAETIEHNFEQRLTQCTCTATEVWLYDILPSSGQPVQRRRTACLPALSSQRLYVVRPWIRPKTPDCNWHRACLSCAISPVLAPTPLPRPGLHQGQRLAVRKGGDVRAGVAVAGGLVAPGRVLQRLRASRRRWPCDTATQGAHAGQRTGAHRSSAGAYFVKRVGD